MIKEIKYNGYSANPSDYECADGDLATSIGVIPENGALKPILPPSEVLQLESGVSVIYIHETTAYKHYIVQNDYYIYWIERNGDSLTSSNKIGYCYDIKSINAVGNTLLVFSADAINYYLWKSNNYTSLGDHIPNIEISFGLRGKPRLYSMNDDSKSTFKITFDGIGEHNLFETWSESNQNKITSQVMAKVNKFLADQTVKKGRFALPFFVRYALRLYDGSLVGHSAPILMNPSTKTAPIVYWERASGKGSYTEAICDIMLVAASLDYKLLADGNYDYNNLKQNWGDIVKSVDVFISKPIYTYDQNGLCKSFADTDNFDTKFIGALDFSGYAASRKNDCILLPVNLDGSSMNISSPSGKNSAFGSKYVEWLYSKLYALYFSSNRGYPSTTIMLPEYSADKNKESLKDVSQFYFLYSIELSDLTTSERKDIIVNDEYLQSLVSREVMTDDYLTHDKLGAEFSHTYNARLNLSGVKRELFGGFTVASMFSYLNSDTPLWKLSGTTVVTSFPVLGYGVVEATVYIKENGNVYGVSAPSHNNYTGYFLSEKRYPSEEDANNGTNGFLEKRSWGCYAFYPNVNAFKMIIRDYKGVYEIKLKPHQFLNGAYAVLDYELERAPQTPIYPETAYQTIVDMPNKIYTSEVNNPFYFPVLGINSVGTGKILGISSAAKALSEGQFGQFPLYAFTTDGVWALEVSSTGTYSAKQPITRDVVINPDSITQIDSSVLFATDKGIMHISGSTTQCLSDSLNAEDLFIITDLPKADAVINIFNSKAGENEKATLSDIILLPFNDFLRECRMVYDYTNQHIIVYNPAVRYAYVFSLKSKLWGMMLSDIVNNVNSYPEALAMADGNRLVDFSTSSAENITALVVTRPFKMDEPDVFKTIDTIIQRGYFKSGHVVQVLYGSNDLFNWHTVWSSTDKYMRGFRGTPYKAFRIALICTLDKSESLLGFSVQFNPRMLNRLR